MCINIQSCPTGEFCTGVTAGLQLRHAVITDTGRHHTKRQKAITKSLRRGRGAGGGGAVPMSSH